MNDTKILIVDDHPVLRKGIRNCLEKEHDFQVIGEAVDGEEAVQLTDKLLPDLILMDISMPKLNGIEATKIIKNNHPNIAVVVLTVHDDDDYILGLLQNGASGYLLKNVAGEKMVQALRLVINGDFAFNSAVEKKLIDKALSHKMKPVKIDNIEHLTSRELEILKLAGNGMTNNGIASVLGVTIRTVKGHLTNIFLKLRVKTRTEAIAYAFKNNWIDIK